MPKEIPTWRKIKYYVFTRQKDRHKNESNRRFSTRRVSCVHAPVVMAFIIRSDVISTITASTKVIVQSQPLLLLCVLNTCVYNHRG